MPERPLFDPSRIRVPESERKPAPAVSSTLTVRQVNELVRGAISQNLPPTLHVLGEIGEISRPASGHLYFTLKDSQSELRSVMWRSSAAKHKFRPEPGMEVIATGSLEVYIPRGTYQLIVRKLEPRGVGALEVAFRQLKQRLEKEGLFDAARKKPLPEIPERIAVVTSPSGAALRDILQTLRRRFPALEVLVFPVRVQGDGAANEIAAAIRALNHHAASLGGIDAMIVGRGGGSLEDLWAFNEEVVARAVAASKIPVISAVGHEVDVSISDLVADVRAATPTAAGELVAPKLSDLLDVLASQSLRAARTAAHALDRAHRRLETALAAGALAQPLLHLRECAQLIDELTHRLQLTAVERFRTAREQLNRAELANLRFRSGAHFVRLGRRLEQRVYGLRRGLDQLLVHTERRLNARTARVQRLHPAARLERFDEHLNQAHGRLAVGLSRTLAHNRKLLDSRLQAIAACDPRQVLQRGYSITRDARTRRVLRSINEIRDKMRIITELSDGQFRATADDPKQPDLFD